MSRLDPSGPPVPEDLVMAATDQSVAFTRRLQRSSPKDWQGVARVPLLASVGRGVLPQTTLHRESAAPSPVRRAGFEPATGSLCPDSLGFRPSSYSHSSHRRALLLPYRSPLSLCRRFVGNRPVLHLWLLWLERPILLGCVVPAVIARVACQDLVSSRHGPFLRLTTPCLAYNLPVHQMVHCSFNRRSWRDIHPGQHLAPMTVRVTVEQPLSVGPHPTRPRRHPSSSTPAPPHTLSGAHRPTDGASPA